MAASLADTDLSGFYEARLARTDGATETRRYAINVDAAEGDLTAMNAPQLAARLEGVKYQYEQAAALQSTVSGLAGYNLSEALLYGLVLLLLVEQILAWSASYHPAASCEESRTLVAVATRGGRRMTDGSLLPLAEGAARTTFEWGRIQSNADWILPIAGVHRHFVVRPLPLPPRRGGAAARARLALDGAAERRLLRPADPVLAAALAVGT